MGQPKAEPAVEMKETPPEVECLLDAPVEIAQVREKIKRVKVTESFLEGGLLTRLPVTTPDRPETCQEAKVDPKCVSDCASSEYKVANDGAFTLLDLIF